MGGKYQLSSLLGVLPPVNYAIAYGSGVFKHFGSAAVSSSTKVVDYVLAVDDAVAWHTENLARNPKHYGHFSKFLGGKRVSDIAGTIGLGIHFNPYVKVGEQLCKYGVVCSSSLISDLKSWDHLFLAGRLHKPVKTLVANPMIDKEIRKNYRAALGASLLLLPKVFRKKDLYRQLCSLSYHGDIRMAFAEDKSKIDNIVSGSERQLDDIYLRDLEGIFSAKAGLVASARGGKEKGVGGDGETWEWRQDQESPSSRAELMTCLPKSILEEAGKRARLGSSVVDVQTPESRWALSVRLVESGEYCGLLKSIFASRVRRASLRQAAYGLLTTDLGKSTHYLAQKIQKAFMT